MHCGGDTKTSSHYLFHLPNYLRERMTLSYSAGHIDPNILDLRNVQLTETLLYYKFFFDKMKNTSILNAIVKYLLNLKDLIDRFFDTL